MRKHRYHAVDKVYGRSSFERLHVECAALLHIVGYIGNVDPKFIKITLFCERDRIIKVFCVLPIDRDRLPVTQIHAPSHVCSTDFIRYIFHLFHDLLGKLHREIIPLHNGHDVCPRIVDMSDDLNDFSLRLFAVFSIICDLNHNFMPGNCSL